MKLVKGMRITCVIQGRRIIDAKIQEQNGKLYICQDRVQGSNCSNKLGFRYSWSVLSGDREDLSSNDVRLVRLYGDVKSKKLSRRKKGNKKQYLITESTYNKLFTASYRSREKSTPFLLGMDKNFIIREALEMGVSGGCYAMASVSNTVLSKAMLAIVKKNLIPCGIARTGEFGRGHDERGTVLSQLRHMNKDSILLSFSGSDERMAVEVPGEKRTFSKLYVVPDKLGKGVKK